jgi:hypothetical protein
MKELRYITGEKPITEEEFRKAQLARIRGYAQQFEGYPVSYTHLTLPTKA